MSADKTLQQWLLANTPEDSFELLNLCEFVDLKAEPELLDTYFCCRYVGECIEPLQSLVFRYYETIGYTACPIRSRELDILFGLFVQDSHTGYKETVSCSILEPHIYILIIKEFDLLRILDEY